MEVTWIKTIKEITPEKLKDMGLNGKKIKLRKGKSGHNKAKILLKDVHKGDKYDKY